MLKPLKLSTKKIIIFLLVFTTLIPDIGIRINTFGFNWTLLRAATPLCILLWLITRRRDTVPMADRRLRNLWCGFMLIWVVYGAILMVVSPYRDIHGGFIELLTLFNGLVGIYILTSLTEKREDLQLILDVIFFVGAVLVLIGLAEIVTGYHLPMSEFNAPGQIIKLDALPPNGATGLSFGVNDFSTLLTCISPVFLIRRKRLPVGIVFFLGAFFIHMKNDANICIFALLIGVVFYVCFLWNIGRTAQRVLRWSAVVIMALVIVVVWINIDYLAERISIMNTIKVQIQNLDYNQGSMWMRKTIYEDTLAGAADTYLLGTGPASFSNYFTVHPSESRLVNPHNLYLEILLEYGIGIAFVFVCGLLYLIFRLRKKILRTREKNTRWELVILCEMLVIYAVACIASSSFIGYAWQWLLFTLGIIAAGALAPNTDYE